MPKLVRDKIPEIIRKDNREPLYYIAEPEEYHEKLRQKLLEEVNEYLESESPEELADILEVVYALGLNAQVSIDELETIRFQKAKERGSFSQKFVLEKN